MLEEKDLQAIAQLIDASLDAKLDAKLAPINERLDQMQTTQDQMQEDLAHVKARLDYDVGKRLNALAEGQSVMEKRLDTLEGTIGEVKELAEKTSDKVDVIHAVVAQHSGAITELKKARG